MSLYIKSIHQYPEIQIDPHMTYSYEILWNTEDKNFY